MRILLVNDDGIDAEGIRSLARFLGKEHEICIAAPTAQRSCYSHKVTYYYQANYAEERAVDGARKAWAIDASPADCVYYALHGLLASKPDLVISGINDGPNMASDVIYSGTVGAAAEALIYHVPALAVSLCARGGKHFDTAAEVASKCIPLFMSGKSRDSSILSINVPDLPYPELKGIRRAYPGGTLDYEKELIRRKEGKGYLLAYDNTPIRMSAETSGPEDDLELVKQGYAVITPLHNDLCRYSDFAELGIFEKLI